MHEVYLERAAERDLRRLPVEEFRPIIPRIKALPEDPTPSRSRKLSGSRNDWRIRGGEYRVVYEIEDDAEEIRVMRIRHRREVYR